MTLNECCNVLRITLG